MSDLPILFSGAMVRALLREVERSGTGKTQTRRTISFPGVDKVVEFVRVGFDKNTGAPFYEMKDGSGQFLTRPKGRNFVDYHYSPRFAVGDRLWVREAWRVSIVANDRSPSELERWETVRYEAFEAESGRIDGRLRAAMHMPRWASRLTLIVTDVRVQRLQEISEEDARSEGVLWVPGHGEITTDDLHEGYSNYLNCREGFQVLWDSLNAKRGYSWDTNPWVVAVTFNVHFGNIDLI